MTITISINGKPFKKDIPTSWDEVSFGELLEIAKLKDEPLEVQKVKTISIATGIDYETLCNAKIHGFDDIMVNRLSFLTQPQQVKIPEKILHYTVPKALEFGQVQQYIDLQNYIKSSRDKSPEDQLADYTLYCAVYACIEKHGKYDWKLVEAMAHEFLQAPCTEVLGIGNFTLLRLIASKNGTGQASHHRLTLLKKAGLVLKSWRLRLASRLRWMIWSKKLGVKKMNY